MTSFCTNFPPEGFSLNFPHTHCDPQYDTYLKDTQKSQKDYCYIAVCVDVERSIIALKSLTKSHTFDYSTAQAIYIQPTLPAKGRGMIEVRLHQSSRSYPDGFMWTIGYSDKMHEWITKLVNQLSDLTGLPVVGLTPFYDC